MMTPQEVASCTFAKAMMGGYNMASVDDFLDKLTEDYSTLYKENAALKGKLKVLADKLKEYREMEDAMRSALLTAQKMANSIVAEAEQKRDALVADAAEAGKRRVEEIRQEVAREEKRLANTRAEVDRQLKAEEQRLAAGREQLRAFVRDVTAVCNGQLALLEKLPQLPVEEPQSAPEPEEPPAPQSAESQEAAVDDISRELQDVFGTLDAAAPAAPPADAAQGEDPFTDGAADEESGDGDENEEDGAATRVMNLDDLQFGRNYMKN